VKFGFKRKNHLKSKRIIDSLFLSGEVLNKPPFRLIFSEIYESDFVGVQVLISVPKRRFKLAVNRNKIRRLISESYRVKSVQLQQQVETEKKHLAIAIVYTGKKEQTFSVIQQKMESVLNTLSSTLKTKDDE
jgi:ribonuclease P protein component